MHIGVGDTFGKFYGSSQVEIPPLQLPEQCTVNIYRLLADIQNEIYRHAVPSDETYRITIYRPAATPSTTYEANG